MSNHKINISKLSSAEVSERLEYVTRFSSEDYIPVLNSLKRNEGFDYPANATSSLSRAIRKVEAAKEQKIFVTVAISATHRKVIRIR